MTRPFKHFTIALAGLGFAAAAVPAAAQPWQSINQRQHGLEARIDQGTRSGTLTRREATQLRSQLRDLTRLEAQYRRSGGGLSNWERRDLNQRFDRLGQKIRNESRDHQRRDRR